ncbi:MAG: nucleotide exchange factor GrpE [Bacteriovorax sp.]|jgi:molecular chaperone GrpE
MSEVENEEVIAESEPKDVIEEEVKGHETLKEGHDFKEKYYYLAAEVENMRKRFEREKENLLKYGNEKVLTGLIAVLDNFDLTVNALKNDNDEKVQNIVKGIDMIRNQFLEVLKQNGVQPVESLGKIFDPNFHEAVAQAIAEGKKDQEVITEYQRGYILNGRLLRAAKVVVASNN